MLSLAAMCGALVDGDTVIVDAGDVMTTDEFVCMQMRLLDAARGRGGCD